ncbi:MAG: hypothetical protein KF751_07195 [Nitrospira sp.]|nr:hypothetical protein [Nitrospira sp.]
MQEDRIVANDNTVCYQGPHLQIPPYQHRVHYVKATVGVHEYPDGMLAVFHGPRCLARYQSDGQIIEVGGTPSGRRSPIRGSGDRPILDPRPIMHERISARG